MKVLHVSGARSWGGNEQQLAELVREISKKGINNVVFGVGNTPLHNYCSVNNIPFIVCRDIKLNKLKNYNYLKTIILEEKPDIIHLHTSDSLTVYTISDLLHRFKTPTVFSKKGMGRSMSWLSKFKYNYKGINKIICVSNQVKNQMKELVIKKKNVHKLVVIYDAVKRLHVADVENITKKYNLPDDVFIVGNIANHTNAKDLFTLLKTISIVVNTLNFKNLHVVQIGSFTSLTEELKEKAKLLNIEQYLTFTGFVENASMFLPQFDAFILTSEREGGPTSVLEAFCYKVPVVSTNVGVLPEVINNGENGFICNVADAKCLAKNLVTLLNDKQLQEKFKTRSYKKFIDFFTTNMFADKTLAVYKSII